MRGLSSLRVSEYLTVVFGEHGTAIFDMSFASGLDQLSIGELGFILNRLYLSQVFRLVLSHRQGIDRPAIVLSLIFSF